MKQSVTQGLNGRRKDTDILSIFKLLVFDLFSRTRKSSIILIAELPEERFRLTFLVNKSFKITFYIGCYLDTQIILKRRTITKNNG